MNPLGTYFINHSHNPGKLAVVNAAAVHRLRRPFNFDLYTYPQRTILQGVWRVSSLIFRAKL